MRVVSAYFLIDLIRQTCQHLRHDGQLLKASTWRSARHWLLGEHGLLRLGASHWRDFFHQDFHPRQMEDKPAQQWLAQHQELWRAVAKT